MFDNLVCDLKDPDKIAQLCNLLRQFQHMFIQEYVELCPYRLSLVSPYRLSLGGREFLGEFKNYCDRFSKDIYSIALGVYQVAGANQVAT